MSMTIDFIIMRLCTVTVQLQLSELGACNKERDASEPGALAHTRRNSRRFGVGLHEAQNTLGLAPSMKLRKCASRGREALSGAGANVCRGARKSWPSWPRRCSHARRVTTFAMIAVPLEIFPSRPFAVAPVGEAVVRSDDVGALPLIAAEQASVVLAHRLDGKRLAQDEATRGNAAGSTLR